MEMDEKAVDYFLEAKCPMIQIGFLEQRLAGRTRPLILLADAATFHKSKVVSFFRLPGTRYAFIPVQFNQLRGLISNKKLFLRYGVDRIW
ncbi:MAG: hypothetical protein ACU837_12435 [Gammaproteobacteria bacterium]